MLAVKVMPATEISTESTLACELVAPPLPVTDEVELPAVSTLGKVTPTLDNETVPPAPFNGPVSATAFVTRGCPAVETVVLTAVACPA